MATARLQRFSSRCGGLLLALLAVGGCAERAPVPAANAEEQDSERGSPRKPEPSFSHVVAADAEYYTTGPQQGRPPDGTFKAGTKVTLLRKAGSYSRVQAENGVTAYVASDALREIGKAKAVEITDDVRAVARSNNRFAFDLYQHLREDKGNLFFSPASISTALAMTYAGAGGPTKTEMAQVLHFDLAEERLHGGFGTLGEILNSAEKGYRLSMANRLWGAKTYPFRPEFLKTTREQYGAELAQLDFARTEEARQTINAWVEEQTNGRIEDLIPSGVLDAMTRLVLTNAVYFKGAWDEEFSKRATQDAPFRLSRDRQVKVPTMRQTDRFGYAETDDLQLLELPYEGHDLSMVIVLPKSVDGLPDLETKLTAESVQKWMSGLRRRDVRVFLPRFKLTSQFELADVLRAMGMPLAFSERADFSGMSTVESLMLSQVVHKAFVDVSEEGTEAAAATAVVVAPTAAPAGDRDEPVVFRADHPFVFLIRDNRTGAVLFVGRVVNPKE